MKLEDIGFYTLSDARAEQASATSPLERCELILTDRCNLRCGYCRSLRSKLRGDMPFKQARAVLDLWIDDGLKHVRFSGGEPTLWEGLGLLVRHCREHGVRRIAVSTNGTATLQAYHQLCLDGVNDFSISLDGACCSAGDMAGGVPGCWEKAIDAIKMLSAMTYVTVGVVLTEDNSAEVLQVAQLASELGVADIRIIPAAQFSNRLSGVDDMPDVLLRKYPILRYRIENARRGWPVRGLNGHKYSQCRLVLDDMAVAGRWHFPCIIYLREGGEPIGRVGLGMREERQRWSAGHNVVSDPICANNCLDVCAAYNCAACPAPSEAT